MHQSRLNLTILFLLLTGLLTSCGGSDGGSAASSSSSGSCSSSSKSLFSSDYFPDGLSVSSLTSNCSSDKKIMEKVYKSGNEADDKADVAAFDATWDYNTKATWFSAVADFTTRQTCNITVPTPTNSTNPSCYGPALTYVNHPSDNTSDGELPTGDLGIWSSTESGTACSAAKMSSDINSVAAYTDMMLTLYATLDCLVGKGDVSAPTAKGINVDVASALEAVIQNNDSQFKISSAAWTVSSGIYNLSIVISPGDTDTGEIHMKNIASGSNYSGNLYGFYQTSSGPNSSELFSLVFSSNGSSLSYRFLGGTISKSYSELNGQESTYFDTSNDNEILGTAAWTSNASKVIAEIDTSTGLGSMTYAWQAGTGDSHARIFNAKTLNDGTSTVGYAWFGYGADFDQSAGTHSDGAIDYLICNWAGPGNDHNTNNGLAQSQKMTLSAAGVWTVSEENITYAPTVSCEYDGTGSFSYGTSSSSMSTDAITKDLEDITASGGWYATYWSAITGPSK